MGPSKGEITIQTALEIMRAGGQKNRIDGLSHLKSIFLHNKKSSNIDALKDGAYHSIFEALFNVAYEEKQACLVAKNPQKVKAEKALTICSDALRMTIRTAFGKLKSKTVKAIIEHVTQLLPIATGEICSGLSQFYLKVLGTVLEHEAHVELLDQDDWLSTVDFCLQGIKKYGNDANSEASATSRTFSRAAAAASSSTQSTTSILSLRSASFPDSTHSITKKNSEELLQCLLYLISASNAPVLERPDEILRGIMHFLQSHGSVVGSIHQVAFSALNIVLSAVNADRTSLSLSTTPEIIHIISYLWSSKTLAKDEMLNSAKDEMLVTILQLHLHIEQLFCNKEVPGFQSKIEDLEVVLRSEYVKRLDRDQLQLDDLDMSTLGSDIPGIASINFGILRLRSHAPRAERNWAILKVLCILDCLLNAKHVHSISSVNEDYNEDDGSKHPRKRRKVSQQFDALLGRIQSQDDSERLVALQTLLVVLPDSKLSAQTLGDLLGQLVPCISDKRRRIGSWAMLCISSCAQHEVARNASCSFNWLQLWNTVIRLISSTLTCRAACYLLHSIIASELVQYQNIAEDVNVMVTATEISTPAILSDSSLALMTHLLLVRNMEVPGGSSVTSHYFIRWLSAKWNPNEKSFAAYCAIDVHPIDILNLLRTGLGLPTLSLSWTGNSPRGNIGQSWLQHLDREEMIRYLLLLNDSSTRIFRCPKCESSFLLHGSERLSDSSAHGHITRRLILELFLPRFESLIQYWGGRSTEESIQVSTDTLRCTASACVFGCLLLSLTQDPRLAHLLEQLEKVVEGLATFVLAQLREEEKMETLFESTLQALQPYLPASNSTQFTHLPKCNLFLLRFFNMVADHLILQSPSFNKTTAAEIPDAMELDDIFDTQQSRSKLGGMKHVSARRDAAVASSPTGFYETTLTRLILVSSITENADIISMIPSAFIDYIIALPDPEILSCRQPLQTTLQSDLSLDPADALRLVQRVGEALASVEYVSCEVALGLCLDILTSQVMHWCSSGRGDGDLTESATQLYEWLISIVLPKRRPSPNVQIGIAKLLYQILRVQPAFEGTASLSSARSCLFNILRIGPLHVKFYIGGQLPSLFGFFILKQHNDILADAIESLPSDPDWPEGIAFRLHALAKLASRWPTLIRLCTYYILEVPGKLPESMDHATRCLAEVAKALGLKTPRDLFQLFASQLLYTWLISESIVIIPYKIFGYGALRDLVEDAQEEIASLMIMRNQDDAVTGLADLLEVTVEQLLQQCFTKVIAYSIAHDVCVPHSENGKKYVTGETRIRKRLGNDVFYNLVNLHFADIIALFFNLIEQEESIVEKSFTKDSKFLYAAEAMNDIKTMSFSEVVLPPSQQPAFKAKYLTSQIEHMCGRTVYDITKLYTPSMVVFIARRLLNSIHPALGSLHTCAVLRKLRVLIALSGRAALEGYPLEMLIHAIRPFITDAECADDSIGIAQYLLARGSDYLATSTSFVAGISLSILASLRAFLKGSPSSTTQQSQYQSTLTKAQAFHSWLGGFLTKYDTGNLSQQFEIAFRAIVQSAHDFRSEGNAETGTPESDLLIELLEDELTGRHLLNKPSRDLAFSLLYPNFKQPSSFRNDIFGTDESAAKFAATLWSLCRDGQVGGPLLIWAGKVIGRAFVATGHIHQQFLQESGVRRITEITSERSSDDVSKSCLLQLLQSLTLGDDRQTAGLAEAILRVIISGPDQLPDETETMVYDGSISRPLHRASIWAPFYVPPSDMSVFQADAPNDPYSADAILEPHWSQSLSISLVQSVPSDAVLYALQKLLRNAEGFAEEAFPFIIHLVLLLQFDRQYVTRRQLSKALRSWLSNEDVSVIPHLKLLINTLLYLRTQKLPRESSSADRINWLEVDYAQAAGAAARCRMFKTALLFTEISVSESARTSRRSSATKLAEPNNLLSIFENIDDPDIFYGIQQNSSLSSILARLEYERDGLKSLAFRGAQYDSHLRQQDKSSTSDAQALVNSLGMLNLDGLSYSLLQSQQAISLEPDSLKNMFQTARKLEQWDLPIPSVSDNETVTLYKAFQSINIAENRASTIEAIDEGVRAIMSSLLRKSAGASTVHISLQSLAVLTEVDEILSASNSEEFEQMLSRFQSRSIWMKTGKFGDVSQILSCRETLLSCLSKRSHLRSMVNVSAADSRLVEVQTSLLSSSLNRTHGALQESLTSATYLTSLIEPCQVLGVNIEAAANLEAANALWEQGEMASSIGMLRALENSSSLKKQTIPIGKSDILAKLGYQVSVARLEKPDRIIEKYLAPALKELKGKSDGSEAGQVFHEFAVFCDQQLQDVDGQEDLERLKRLKEMKESEVRDLARMAKAATSSEQKLKYHSAWTKAKQWLQLDSEEYRRLSSSKDELLRQSLENYLLSLTASDDHNNDALRFSALWLEHSKVSMVNDAVSKHLSSVPTRKFASLMNQLTSRLLNNATKFQQLLFSLILNICTDHPYHGMYQIYAGCKGRNNTKDETAVLRHAATTKVGQQLNCNPKSAKVWSAISNTNKYYCQLATERNEAGFKAGQKVLLKDSPAGSALNQAISRYLVPPPTLQVEIAADLDYSRVPVMQQLEPQFSIASGVSAPKVITAIASDGSKYKQLVKGGNDDLRQDAIMEQVFAQVSELLRTNSSTRQRNLGIRTYKVLPLNSNTGIIEFVSNTIPLHEFLIPAHERYYPKDLKGSQCRKQIGDVQTQRLEVRLKAYRTVTDQFHPVLRYFFIEKFHDPDEWFAKRLAYTRSTAAISMLGHVLGLGDRHGHNILLDEKTGEVVHIDLGVAFEMGRVLPVPELVPFRLTRDIVDGMGITKTEGVYRRCCEFTLEALRNESYSIVTILDVLRYDPLYSWSISPLRLAKLQEAQSVAPALNPAGEAGTAKTREVLNEPSEADRALTVVKKKLSKTLSVTATVNDLINQATDERNLAVLYSGWAAYA